MSSESNSLTLAADYVRLNPRTTAPQLQQRFETLSIRQCRRLIDTVRRKLRESGVDVSIDRSRNADPVYQLARTYGMANPSISPGQLRQLYPISVRHSQNIMSASRQVVREAREAKNAAKMQARMASRESERQQTKSELAKRYAADNPSESCESIARQFGVPATSLRRFRRMNSVATAAIATEAVKVRRRRKLCGLIDGNWVPVERMSSREIPDRYSVEVV